MNNMSRKHESEIGLRTKILNLELKSDTTHLFLTTKNNQNINYCYPLQRALYKMPFQKNQFNILNIYQFDLIKKHQIINNCVQFNVGHNVHLYTCLKSWLDKRVKHMVRHLKYMIDMDIMIVIET